MVSEMGVARVCLHNLRAGGGHGKRRVNVGACDVEFDDAELVATRDGFCLLYTSDAADE